MKTLVPELLLLSASLFAPSAASAADLPAVPSTPAAATPVEEIDVAPIEQKYWARGEEAEMGVVQNRIYSKARKVDLQLFGGFVTSDPFLTIKAAGFSAGYHFSESLGLHLLAWKHFVSPSTALLTFEEFRGATVNTNLPRAYAGGEASWSVLYGKLSLLGKAILYYDMHGALGLGATFTESGNYVTPSFGVGQRFFISTRLSLRFDYRMLYYRETIVEKVIPTKLGQPVGTRNNFNNTIFLGIDLLIGGGSNAAKGEEGPTQPAAAPGTQEVKQP